MLAFYIVSGFILVCSYIHLIKYEAWWIRIFDFIHIQLAILTVTIITLGFVFLSFTGSVRVILILLMLTFLYHIRLILPFTFFYKKQVLPKSKIEKADSLKAMVSNVYQYNKKYKDVLSLVKKAEPDIFLVLEADSLWEAALAELGNEFKYKISCPLENTYGMILYSKLKIETSKINFLIEKDIPSFELTVVLPSGITVDIYTAHPQPPSPTEHSRSTERDAELLQIAKKVKAKDRPTLVLGDLNDVAWSHTTRLFKRISSLLDPRIGRGLFNTFNAKIPFLRFPLDHVFSSHHFTLGRIERLPHCNSDHFPIFIELFYEPKEESKQNQVVADKSDHKEANEKIAEAKL